MAASMASCEGMWLRKLLAGLFECDLEATVVHCDNQSGIRLSENPVFHDQSGHIDTRYHFLRDCVQREPFGWSTYKQMSKWRTFSPRHFANKVL